MNLLHVIASMDPVSGGPCQVVRNSIQELQKLDVNNEVVSLDDKAASFVGKDSFAFHALGHQGQWRFSPHLIPWLKNNLNRFDAVIVHGLWLYHGYAVNRAINLLKRDLSANHPYKVPKVFIMPHGMLDPYFQKAMNRKLKALRNWMYWKLIEKKVVNQSEGLLFTCEEELKLAKISFTPYHPRNEVNIGYGIEKPPFFTRDMQEAFFDKCPEIKSQSYFLFLSRIHEKKGVDILLHAYRKKVNDTSTHKRYPKLVIAGPGLETAYGLQMQKLVSSCSKLNSNVYFSGMLSGPAKWGAFYGCDAFVLPSHQENFGIAVVEALSCGKPVLISNQVNIWKEIELGGGGLVFNDSQDDTKETLISWLKLSIEEKRAFKLKAQNLYRNCFTIESATRNLMMAIK